MLVILGLNGAVLRVERYDITDIYLLYYRQAFSSAAYADTSVPLPFARPFVVPRIRPSPLMTHGFYSFKRYPVR